ELESKHIQSGAIGELHAALRVIQGDADMNVFDKGTESLFVGTKKFLGGLTLSDIANDDQGTTLAVEIEESTGHVAKAKLAGFSAEAELAFLEFAGADKFREEFGAACRIFPETQIGGSFLEDLLAGVAGETSEAVVDVDVGAVGEEVDGHGVRAGTKRRGKHAFGPAQSFLDVEECIAGAALFAIGENQTEGGADEGSGDDEPRDKELLFGDLPAH